MYYQTNKVRQVIATILMFTVGSFSNFLLTTSTAQTSALKFAGELAGLSGTVMLNGIAVKTGAMLLNGSRIETGEGASATINLGNQGQLVLGANSTFVLESDTGNITGHLRNGSVITHLAAGANANVVTADATAHTNGVMTVDVNCGSTRVLASTNDVKIIRADKTEIVAAGNEAIVGAPQNNSRCPRMATGGAGAGAGGAAIGALSGGALATLLIVGIGGAVAGIVAATQGDENTSGIVVSAIR